MLISINWGILEIRDSYLKVYIVYVFVCLKILVIYF